VDLWGGTWDHVDLTVFKSRKLASERWFEPPYDLNGAHAANIAAEGRNPAFKKMMDDARAKVVALGKKEKQDVGGFRVDCEEKIK
jgi:hypothetical protein